VVLRALLAEPVVADCATDQLHRIKFLSLKNLAELLARQGQQQQQGAAVSSPRPEGSIGGGGGVAEALSIYCQATEVVADDAVLWNKLGTLVSG
jgi:hypothetical protein